MRLCRYCQEGNPVTPALLVEERVFPLPELIEALGLSYSPLPKDLLQYLPPSGPLRFLSQEIVSRFPKLTEEQQQSLSQPIDEVQLLVPIPDPKKIILLAGNYADHVREGGDRAEERDKTFPYFFWKPPSTTLTAPNAPVRLPKVSPDHIDWEIELAVIIGNQCRNVSEEEALMFVAGYSVCVDVSDRKFQINPQRAERGRDKFFDWLHGKWHDTFFPMGPAILAASDTIDTQNLSMTLKVNGETMQQGSTSQMVFPVAALISTLSSFVTLERGDIISTGTPSGVGGARKPPIFLKAGDKIEAEIEKIGVLRNPVEKG